MLHNGIFGRVSLIIMQSMLVTWRVFPVTLSHSRSVRGDWREGHSLTHLQVSLAGHTVVSGWGEHMKIIWPTRLVRHGLPDLSVECVL